MEKILRTFPDHESAAEAARSDDNRLTYQQRFDAFMELMSPYYAAAGGL